MNNENAKPKYNMWKTTRYISSLAWRWRKSIFLLLAIEIFVNVALNLSEILIVPVIISQIEIGESFANLLITISIFVALLFILNGIKGYLVYVQMPGQIEVRVNILSMLNVKKATTSYPNTQAQTAVNKFEKALETTSSNSSPAEAIWGVLMKLIYSALAFIIYIILLLNINIIVVLIVSITCLISYFYTAHINKWVYAHSDEKAEHIKNISYANKKSHDVEFAKDIRIFGMGEWINDMYTSALNLFIAFKTKQELRYLKSDILELIFTFARNAIAYLYLINLVLSGTLTAAEFLLYFSAVGAFTQMLTQFLQNFAALDKQCVLLSAIPEYVEIEEPFKFENGISIAPIENEKYEIEFENVSFKYPGAQNNTINNLNLKLSYGEKLAIVGLNGAGKTTLVKLMCGFYDATQGRVLLNGQDIKQYNRQNYYDFFTAVFQSFSVLDVTIAENVAQTAKNIDYALVEQCIEKAGLTKKINSFENGINTHIGKNVYEDGIELSGGETQRLMLARALYKNAPFIVLDEPTAALDPLAESDIYSKYNDMTKNHSSVFISHRLASTKFCDRIIFLENGEIAEVGTHDNLMQMGKKYAHLFDVQSKYYQEGANF